MPVYLIRQNLLIGRIIKLSYRPKHNIKRTRESILFMRLSNDCDVTLFPLFPPSLLFPFLSFVLKNIFA